MDPRTPTTPSPPPAPSVTATASPPPDPDDDAPGEPAPPLRRRTSRRLLAGVCAGIAERLDLDVSLVRVAFVVLAFAWGAGVVIYAAMWALVPRATGDRDDVVTDGEPTASWLAFLLLGGVLVLGLVVLTSWWGGPRWGSAFSVVWVVVLGGLVVVALRRPGQRRSVGRLFLAIGVSVVTIAIVLTGGFLALVASTGVPLSGGIGERVYSPSSLAEVHRTYRVAFGNLTVDLRHVHFGPKPLDVTASVAVGKLTVVVPPGVVVDVSAHSAYGDVTSSPGSLSSFSSPASGHPQLVLTADAGVGVVQLVRSSASG
ncbi:MAG TPA: PspC domain-containing protein [Acidimicrobiales bacterium]|nr:PspC domain-containing protein [Acidimicrobiales bacterium]